MKPTKNHAYCIDCMRPKMLFASEAKALRCIEMNGDEIFNQSRRRPIRAYYCIACGGWHITSKTLNPHIHSHVERYFMKQDKMKAALKRLSEILPGSNFEKALKNKVETFSKMVMKKKIVISHCKDMIHELIHIFQEICRTDMITKSIRKCFNRFFDLCTIAQSKIAKGKVYPETQLKTA